MGHGIACTVPRINYRMAATLYTLETRFVSGMSVVTLHKGDGSNTP